MKMQCNKATSQISILDQKTTKQVRILNVFQPQVQARVQL